MIPATLVVALVFHTSPVVIPPPASSPKLSLALRVADLPNAAAQTQTKPAPSQATHRSGRRKLVYGIAGAIGGAYVGAVVGGAIDKRTGHGYTWQPIGTPVGAVVGGALGYYLAGR